MQENVSYRNREEAGQRLAEALGDYAGRDDCIVLGLPRGGVPVAARVAASLSAPLDVMVVRKLGLPMQPELAMGAIASGGALVLNPEVAGLGGVSDEMIQRVAARERGELQRREQLYRGSRTPPEVKGRCVILVDDGLATGSTMRAAVAAVRQLGAKQVVVAVPVAPPQTVDELREEADEVVCPATPLSFQAVGQWYEDFDQTSDEEVQRILQSAR